MKKIAISLLMCVLVLSLAACSSGGKESSDKKRQQDILFKQRKST
ncbi:hypothetical protein [Listeria aquatica]